MADPRCSRSGDFRINGSPISSRSIKVYAVVNMQVKLSTLGISPKDMRRAAFSVALAAVGVGSSGCVTNPGLKRAGLYTVDASVAPYPVMLSRWPHDDGEQGRRVSGHADWNSFKASPSSMTAGGTTYYSSGWSRESISRGGASRMVLLQAGPAVRWVLIDAVRFVARDENGLGTTSSERSLNIEGRAKQ
jgi:hypothetical protein